jgi:hypothetical protein
MLRLVPSDESCGRDPVREAEPDDRPADPRRRGSAHAARGAAPRRTRAPHPKDRTVPTATAHRPAVSSRREPAIPPRPRRRRAGFGPTLVRVLTVLVGLGTAVITLGPRSMVVDGRSGVETWLLSHPGPSALVDSLGGVEPAGNLVLFAPFAALLALSVRLRFLPVAFLLLLGSPVAVEWAQTVLPGRVPDGGDVVRNTIGLLSAFIVVWLLRMLTFGVGRLADGFVRAPR